jgi:hypothetical protein
MWIGDLNCRVGHKIDYIQKERVTDLDFNDVLNDIPSRQLSMDYTSNRFGDYLLDICKSTNMCILNDRSCVNDKGVFTCFTHNSKSLMDYVVTSYSNFDLIKGFKVHQCNEFSNHIPISLHILIGTCNSVNNLPTRVYSN